MLHQRMGRLLFAFSSEIYPAGASLASSGSTFHASKLTRHLRSAPSVLPEFKAENLLFGRNNSDHMISVDWERKSGWAAPALVPFENLQLHPFSSALHYGIQCFEGLKAYRNSQGEIRIFRP